MTTLTTLDPTKTGPGTLAGRYLRLFWQPIYYSCDLEVGRSAPVRVIGEDFTLYRGETGAVHLVDFRCAHRGTQLSVGWVEGDCIRCRYHGWMYEGSGQCVDAPAEKPGLAGKVRIGSHPVREYLGVVFAYLGEGPAPDFPRYPEWESGGVLEVTGHTRPCNYFQNIENGVDPMHTPFTHRDSLVTAAGLAELPSMTAERTEWGLRLETVRSDSVRVLLHGMPNISNVKLPSPAGGWKDSLAWRVPIDDASHRSFILYRHPCTREEAERCGIAPADRGRSEIASSREDLTAVLAGDLRLEDVTADPDALVDLQDCVAQVGQGVVADRRRERLGQSDVGVILLRRIWKEELEALAEGRQMRTWRRPEGLIASTSSAL